MGLFVWDEKYSTKNEEIDGHHKNLFNILNTLYDICSVTNDIDALDPVVDELARYAAYHFAQEEKYMRSVGYEDIGSHARQHEMFRKKVSHYQEDENRNMISARELAVFLGGWLLDHVLEEDIEMLGKT